jgi:hypothetical protein
MSRAATSASSTTDAVANASASGRRRREVVRRQQRVLTRRRRVDETRTHGHDPRPAVAVIPFGAHRSHPLFHGCLARAVHRQRRVGRRAAPDDIWTKPTSTPRSTAGRAARKKRVTEHDRRRDVGHDLRELLSWLASPAKLRWWWNGVVYEDGAASREACECSVNDVLAADHEAGSVRSTTTDSSSSCARREMLMIRAPSYGQFRARAAPIPTSRR